MDESVIRAVAKWPAVPAVYGWLALDERGQWLLRDPKTAEFGRIGNAALRDFIGRNYARDARGCWFFQNGPQRVFVRLACGPFVFHLEGQCLINQCGRAAGTLSAAWRDDQGALILATPSGVGNLDDRDLIAVSEGIEESEQGAWLAWAGHRVPLERILRAELPARFGFVRDPRPEESAGVESR